jgi:PAS domain S-box-containing protein
MRRLVQWAAAHLQALGLSFLLIVFAAAVFWFFAAFVPDRRQMAIEGWQRELSLRADFTRDVLERRLLDATEELTFVAAFPSVRELLIPGLSENTAGAQAVHLERILSDFRRNYHLRSVSILDPSGRVRASGGGSGPGAAALALASDVIRSGAPLVALAREPNGVTGLAGAVPVMGEAAGAGPPPILGAVLSVVDASTSLFDLLGPPMVASSSEALLVGKDAKDILFLSPLRFRPDPPLSFRLPLATGGLAAREAFSGKETFQVASDYRGTRVFAAVRQLTSAPWGLVVKIDEEEALAAFRKDVVQRGITWGALLLAVFAASAGLWRSLAISDEMKIARSEASFRNLFEHANDAVFIIGRDGKIRDANRAAEENYGFDHEALVGRHVADFRPEDQRDVALANLEAAHREGRLVFEGEHVRADGSRFPVEVSTRLVDIPGDPVHLSIVRDVTARKAAEDRIRKLNRVHRTISEVNQLLVRATDEESLLKDVCRILDSHGGYALAWVGRADRETMRVVPVASAGDEVGYLERIEVRWDDTPEGRGPLGTAIREGHPAIVTNTQVDPVVAPWRTFMLERGFGSLAALPIRRGGAVTAGLVVFAAEKGFVDAEEIVLLEELVGNLSFALDAFDDRERTHESDLELRKLWRAVEQTPATVMITDLEGRIEYVNPRFTEVTGYKAEEARGQNPRILKSDRTPPEVHRAMWETITAGRVWQGELCNQRKDGTLFWEQVSISPIRDEHGTTMNYVAVKEDITLKKRAAVELEKTQRQLQQAQKMDAVGRLAGGVAHDFNNLLTVIQGYGEVLQASLKGDAEKSESVVEIVKAAERAATLTRQLLAFSRQQVLEMHILDVGAVIADTEKMLKRLIGEDIEVVVVKPAALGRVKANSGQIEQVVLNLAVNARDAMPGGGRLTLELADADLDAPLAAAQDSIPPGRYVVLSVSDTGTGMDAETVGHIFEPFFTTKEKGKGTGLGLATVYGIVRQTGGYVAVETSPGAGTTFRIYLLRCAEQMTSEIRPSVPSRHGTETVLLVEDEPAVRTLVRAVLERHGYAVLVAEDGEAGLDIITRDPRPIHVLLTDLVMPKMNGRELASRVAALRPSIKVVFMSGYAADVVRSVDESGASGFLAKPFSERALTAKLREVLDAPPA